jgi:uncharacterized protein YecE (DUF72 family)
MRAALFSPADVHEGQLRLQVKCLMPRTQITAPKTRPFLSREEWRAKRQARRERQREQNVVRAAQMREARLAPDAQPKEQQTVKLAEFYVGCSGWYYWHWRGRFYPPDAQTSEWFTHYAKSFNTVELNAPFYAWPTVRTIETWKRQRGQRRLLYTVKANELITHTRRFSRTAELIKDFALIADLLGPAMGCFLFQLPPSFKYSPARLKRITDQLDPRHRNVVEFRHKSWWNAKVYAAFRARGIIFCSCSGPRVPDELVTTASDVYIRFHGRKRWYRHDYTQDELRVWAQRIRDAKPVRVWAYFNNDREGYAPKNAKGFLRLLRERT